MITIGMISDTHGHYEPTLLGDLDLFLHAGDLCKNKGNEQEFIAAVDWISTVKAKHKIVIGGNHDCFLQKSRGQAERMLDDAGILYLQDRLVEINGLKIYGSPWTEARYDFSFELPEEGLVKKWGNIPLGVDILVTHSPPLGILDQIGPDDRQGSGSLLHRVFEVKPLLHLFGHIHEAYGYCKNDNCWFVNAAIGLYPAEERLPFVVRMDQVNDKWQVLGIGYLRAQK